jgi:hypothetical protein
MMECRHHARKIHLMENFELYKITGLYPWLGGSHIWQEAPKSRWPGVQIFELQFLFLYRSYFDPLPKLSDNVLTR